MNISSVQPRCLSGSSSSPQPSPSGDRIARKYCFRALTTISRKDSNRTFGVVFGYDSKPIVAKEVEVIAQNFCEANDHKFEADDVELVLYEECPVELSDEIHFQVFQDSTDEDDIAGA